MTVMITADTLCALSHKCVNFNVFLFATHKKLVFKIEDDPVKYLVTIPTILFLSATHLHRYHPHPVPTPTMLSHPHLSVCMLLEFCPHPNPQSLLFVLYIIFLNLVFCMLFFFVLRQGYCNKKHLFNWVTIVLRIHRCLQYPDYIIFPLNHYRYHGITASYLPPLRYYCEISPSPRLLWYYCFPYYHVIL